MPPQHKEDFVRKISRSFNGTMADSRAPGAAALAVVAFLAAAVAVFGLSTLVIILLAIVTGSAPLAPASVRHWAASRKREVI
jgi:hypothetical protein